VGRPALRRHGALYVGIAVCASVLFGPQGAEAATIATLIRSSPLSYAGAWSFWLVAAAPIAAALLIAPATFAFRALPIRRTAWLGVQGAHLFAAELPWVIFWARGEGLVSGLASAAVAMGAHAWLVGRPRRLRDGWRPL